MNNPSNRKNSLKQDSDALISNNAKNQKKHIHVTLKPSRIEKFEFIKTHLDMNSDVDVIRSCIDQVYEFLTKGEIKFRPELQQVIENMLENEYLKNRHLVFSINDVINEALHQWIRAKMSEINLHAFPFRKELSEEEQQIALVFVEQQINFDRGMSVKDIMHFLKDPNETRVWRILKKFLNQGLIQVTTIESIEYFYATPP
ncbi:MAG: hypothetical protein ACFFAJ_12895 [Candidatus Hodarchaeota archaeon]